MRQFTVCRLKDARSAKTERLVVVLQHDLLSDLRTRIVAPLLTIDESDHLGRIAPEISFGDRRYRLCLYELATIDLRVIGEALGTIDAHDDVMRGVDQLFAGV